MEKISTKDARKELTRIIDDVRMEKRAVCMTRWGKMMAAIVPIEWLDSQGKIKSTEKK